MLSYIAIINSVRLCKKHNYLFINVKKTKKNIYLLSILRNLNLIHGWSEIVTRNNLVLCSIYCNHNNTKQIQTFLKPSKQLYIKNKSLKKLSKHFNSASIFLTTSKGVISIKEAVKKK
jgi:ribosomal protein S8